MAETPKAENPIIVLKFGGSVLLDEQRLGLAVNEIYRWRREGWSVVAVVSALSGETETLIAQGETVCADASGYAKAALIGLGEAKSAATLGLLLDRAGIPARTLSPAGLRLICSGEPLRASPEDIDTDSLRAGLDQDGVVVVPGFIGIDAQGRPVTLGRGGSDSTAVFIAGQLGADCCRLIKDVDGLYTDDPAKSVVHAPSRFDVAHYDDALATDGSIIQHESINLARALDVQIELGALNSDSPSIIGANSCRLSPPRSAPRPLRVAVCGLGTVGGGVVRQLSLLPDAFVLAGVACRSPEKHTDLEPMLGRITSDPIELAQDEADVLVELVGGTELAYEIVSTSLRSGKHVVTANKALIAEFGRSLHALAEENGVELLYSASVGGSLPVLERLRGLNPVHISGVLNGTSQYVLNAMTRGTRYSEAVDDAQRLGFAEADPNRDLDGRDALDKLRVIALQLGWDRVAIETPSCDLSVLGRENGSIRQVGTLTAQHATVRLEPSTPDSGLVGLGDSENLVEIVCADSSIVTLRGRGAGRWPTSVSVLGDLLELSRSQRSQEVLTKEEVVNAIAE